MGNKKMYYHIQSSGDMAVITEDLDTIMNLIKNDLENIKYGSNDYSYAIIIEWLTDNEFAKLSEAEF